MNEVKIKSNQETLLKRFTSGSVQVIVSAVHTIKTLQIGRLCSKGKIKFLHCTAASDCIDWYKKLHVVEQKCFFF